MNKVTNQSCWLVATLLAVTCCLSSLQAQQAEWAQFRGPAANPTAENEKLPSHWSTTENVEWMSEIPGRGWSSPIVSGGKVFLTTVTTDGKSKPPQTGVDFSNDYIAEMVKQGLSEEEIEKRVTERDTELPEEVELHYFLFCLDLETGKEIWKQEFYSGHPPCGRHRKNSFTSETPVTDGELVYVYITNLGLFAFDFDGNLNWNTELESYPIYLEFGTGASPTLHENRLIIVHDNQENSFIAAYDKKTGNELWRTDRPAPEGASPQMPLSGWVTPYIWQNDVRTEIVTVGPGIATSYDLDGKELWRLRGMTPAPAASSFAYDGMLYLNGGRGRAMSAIRPGAVGDLTPTEPQEPSEHMAWTKPRTGTYIPTPVAYDGGLYVVSDKGIMVRLNTATGEQTFKTRLKADGADFTCSPWAYNGNVYCLSEQGDTFVLAAGDDYELLHVNPLGEMSMATPAIVGDRLLIRTESKLYSIREQN